MKKLANYLIPNINQIEREILDFDLIEIVKKLDNCNSKIGKQFLCYKVLNSIRNNNRLEEFSVNLNLCPEYDSQYKKSLKNLNKDYNLDLVDIVFGNSDINGHWSFGYSKFLLLLVIISIVGFNFNPLFFSLLFTILFVINMMIFLIGKGIVINSKYYLLNLLDFSKTCNEIIEFDKTITFQSKNIKYNFLLKILTIEDNIESITPVGFLASSTIEIFKAIFLIDSLIINFLESKIKIDKNKLKSDYFLIANLDFNLSLNTLKKKEENVICTPVFNDKAILSFNNLIHPLIDNCIGNSIDVNDEIIMVTGSNLAGKSTFLKAIAINLILGKSLNICFAKSASLNNLDVYSSFKISDDLFNAKSFFNVELDVIKTIVDNSDSKSIVLLDEPFKGTNSSERMALNISVLKYLYKKKCKIILTTHDVKLFSYISNISLPYNFNLTMKQDKVFFDYQLKKGVIINYYAIQILKSKGFPNTIINESIEIINNLKNEK
jgi:MutS domain V